MSITTPLILMMMLAPAADDAIPVPGSSITFPVAVATQENGQVVQMGLTGVAMRKKLIVNVYAMGSYLDKTVKVANAEELAAADSTKWLFLVMERNVGGPEMATAISDAVKANNPNQFAEEIAQVIAFFEKQEVKRGDRIWLAHKPGKGIIINVAGRAQLEVPSVAFSKAIWGIYLGAAPISDTVKQGLASRLW